MIRIRNKKAFKRSGFYWIIKKKDKLENGGENIL